MGWRISKTKIEWETRLKRSMQLWWEECKEEPRRAVHHYTDFFVESARAAPYTMGHVHAIAYPIFIIAIGVLAWN